MGDVHLLDASALLAAWQGDVGADRVRDLLPLAQNRSVNLLSVLAKLGERSVPDMVFNDPDPSLVPFGAMGAVPAVARRSGLFRVGGGAVGGGDDKESHLGGPRQRGRAALLMVDASELALAAPAPLIPHLLDEEIEAARAYVAAARAPATRRAYASDWRIFQAWCAARGVEALPAEPGLVAIFLSAEAKAGVRPSTIGRRLAAIGYAHAAAGFDPPRQRAGAVAIRNALAGIRRTHGVAKVQKRAADGDMLRDMLRACEGGSARAIRDRALLAIGMAAALRRSELVALTLDDVRVSAEGLTITVRHSKTDQEGAGAAIAVPEGRRIRPKALLLDWIAHAGFAEGPVFRKLTPQGRISPRPMSDRGVALVVKARAAAAGYDPAQVSGHSLRAGFLTEAARQGATVFKMKEVSRHKSLEVLSDYVRSHELFRDHAGERFL